MTTDVFFMVYAKGGQAPTAKHATIEEALAEASRIAHKGGTETFILRSIKKITPKFDVQSDDL